MDKQLAIMNLRYALNREADLSDEAVEMAITALETQIVEVPRNTMEATLTSIPINEGGFPKFMLDESIMPTIDLLDKRLMLHGLRIAFVKTEK